MHALWLENNKLTLRDDLSKPLPVAGYACIEVLLAGICSTDLECIKGYTPFCGVLGHEFVGTVVQGDSAWLGRRVVADINVACGTCKMCRAKLSHHCTNRDVLGLRRAHGAFAEYVSVPHTNLYPVPEGLSNEAAVFTEPLAAALAIQETNPIRAEDRVLVIGAGRLGLLIAQALAMTGCELTIVTRHAHQQDLLVSWNIPWVSEQDTPNREMDVVVDATGTPGGFELALKAVRPRGIVILKSTYQKKTSIDLTPVVVHEITVRGSRCGPMDKALKLLDDGLVNPLPLIAKRYPLELGLEAFKYAAQSGVLKVLLEPS